MRFSWQTCIVALLSLPCVAVEARVLRSTNTVQRHRILPTGNANTDAGMHVEESYGKKGKKVKGYYDTEEPSPEEEEPMMESIFGEKKASGKKTDEGKQEATPKEPSGKKTEVGKKETTQKEPVASGKKTEVGKKETTQKTPVASGKKAAVKKASSPKEGSPSGKKSGIIHAAGDMEDSYMNTTSVGKKSAPKGQVYGKKDGIQKETGSVGKKSSSMGGIFGDDNSTDVSADGNTTTFDMEAGAKGKKYYDSKSGKNLSGKKSGKKSKGYGTGYTEGKKGGAVYSETKSGKRYGKGKGKGKGKGSDNGATMPPTEMEAGMPTSPTAPVMAPVEAPVMAPSMDDTPSASDQAFILPSYSVLYTIEQTRIPNLMDYRGLLDVTEGYLDGFFDGVLGVTEDVLYSSSSTEITARSFILGRPVSVEYNTTVYFEDLSPTIPTDEELQALIMSAFRGNQNADYLELLGALPGANIFSTTTTAEFIRERTTSGVGRNSGAGTDAASTANMAGIASAAAAGALILLVTGYVVYRRRNEEEDPVGKFLESDGHVTVAGETYAGGSSLDSQSEAHRVSRPYEASEWDDSCQGTAEQDDLSQRAPFEGLTPLEYDEEEDSDCGPDTQSCESVETDVL